MSEIIEGQAVVVPAVFAENSFEGKTPEEQQKIREQLLELQSVTADALVQTQGWEILREFYNIVVQKILATSTFVVPVLQNRDAITAKLEDGEAFWKEFRQLLNTMSGYQVQLSLLWSKHETKLNAPTAEDLPLISELVDGYTALLRNFETVTEPLMFKLIDIVSTQYGSELTVQLPGTEEKSNEQQ